MRTKSRISIERLFRYYHVEGALNGGFKLNITKKIAEQSQPVDDFVENKPFNDTSWHAGRIRYFMEQLRHGEELAVPLLENKNYGGETTYPFLADGHHRILAAWYSGRTHVTVSYSGRLDILEYLQGTRDQYPEGPVDLAIPS